MRLILVVSILLWAVSPSAAFGDEPRLSVDKEPHDGLTSFALGPLDDDCGPDCIDATVTIGGHDISFESGDDELDEYTVASYSWSCAKPGRKTWTVHEDYYSPDTGDVKYTRMGAFTVPRCGRWAPRAVSRDHVAHVAANWPDEFVSSSRCTPTTALTRGKASRWTCVVTHNDTIRECATTFTYRFQTRRKWGVTDTRDNEKRGGQSCRYF